MQKAKRIEAATTTQDTLAEKKKEKMCNIRVVLHTMNGTQNFIRLCRVVYCIAMYVQCSREKTRCRKSAQSQSVASERVSARARQQTTDADNNDEMVKMKNQNTNVQFHKATTHNCVRFGFDTRHDIRLQPIRLAVSLHDVGRRRRGPEVRTGFGAGCYVDFLFFVCVCVGVDRVCARVRCVGAERASSSSSYTNGTPCE